MNCDNCTKRANEGLYECEHCRNDVCQTCIVNTEFILCVKCNKDYIEGIIKKEDMNSWLTKCDNCGNLWDGNAQCNCWEYNFDENE
jgi:hypothetical protein